MKITYYIMGGFLGFGCGSIINLIFYWLHQSGNPFASYLVKNYGVFGEFILQLINALPIFGIAFGIILVRIMFAKNWDEK